MSDYKYIPVSWEKSPTTGEKSPTQGEIHPTYSLVLVTTRMPQEILWKNG